MDNYTFNSRYGTYKPTKNFISRISCNKKCARPKTIKFLKTFHFQSQVLPIAICKLLHVSNLSRGNPIIKNEETHTGEVTRVLNDFGEECFITRIKKIDGNIKEFESLSQLR